MTAHNCSQCGRSFDKPWGLKVHMRKAHGITIDAKPQTNAHAAYPKRVRVDGKTVRVDSIAKREEIQTKPHIQPAANLVHFCPHCGQSIDVIAAAMALFGGQNNG